MALTNIETNIILDLYDHDLTPTKIKAIQLDSNTRYVSAVIRARGGIYDVGQNTSITLTVIRPDKVGVQITGETVAHTETTPDEQTITTYGAYAELSLVALAKKGTLKAQFMLKSGDQVLRTEIFTISCGEALDESTDTWAGEYQGYNLDELVQSVNESSAKVDAMEQDVSDLKSGFNDLYNTAYVTDSANGSIAHFVDGADSVPMKYVKVNIAPVQSGSGDPSPENVRPISGFNSVKVTRTGKNVFPSKGLTQTINGITIRSNSDGSFTVNGTATANAQFDLTLNNELKLQAGQYTVGMFADKAVTFNNQNVWWFFYNMDAHADIVNCQSPSKTFTLSTITSTRFYLRIISGATVDNVTLYPILVYGSDAPTEFEPYNGNTYNISLASAGTVYGGMLDVVSGELTVTTELYSVTRVSGTATSGNVRQFFTTKDKPNASAVACNSLKLGGQSDLNAVSVNNEGRIVVTPDWAQSMTTAEEFNSALASHPINLVVTLANPQTYQLTPTEVKSLLGINNIWSDAGDVEVEYRADTKLYINKRLAEVTI